MPSSYLKRAAVAALAMAALWLAPARAIGQEAGGSSNLTIFVRGQPLGNEQVTMARTAEGWTITSSGRIGPPVDAFARHLQVRYTADWRPIEFNFEGTLRGLAQSIHTVVQNTQATSDVDTGGQKSQKTDVIDPNALIVLPTTFFGPFEAVAVKLKTTPVGGDIAAYGAPTFPFSIRVGESVNQQIQTTSRLIAARKTAIKLALPGAVFDADIWTDENGRLLRLSVPAQSLEVVRDDIASVASRTVIISRPNDEAIKIPGAGFVLAGTLSRPASSPDGARLPAVVLVGGSGPSDRDGLVFGIPILGQIADAIADAGFIVVRYDKRGIGQSGGRAESAGLADYAEDVRSAVKWLSERKDVDPKRITVIGHSEGGDVALIAASKDKRIASVGLLATNGVSGADLILAQQAHALDRLKISPEERQAKIDLQKQIHQAVLTGTGWDKLPPGIRRTVDVPEFQSLLAVDPARLMPDVKQPLLIVQGALDTQVAPSNADRLEELARKRKNQPPVEVIKVPGVNHLLVPASTGEVDEYGSLPDKHVSPAVTQAIVTWLTKKTS